MTCRVARWVPTSSWNAPITCSDCGATNLTVFYTSEALGLQLCKGCFQSRVERDLAKEG